jgi:hypothetical protein
MTDHPAVLPEPRTADGDEWVTEDAYSEDGRLYAFRWPHGWIACSTDRDDILTHFYDRDEAATAAEVLVLFAEDTGLQLTAAATTGGPA